MKRLIEIFLLLSTCSPDLYDDPIPFISFSDIVINLGLPEYANLNSDGGYKYIGGEVRGIIIYRQSASNYRAFERNCSYKPNDACATVEVHSSTLFMADPCCGSNFSFNGDPNGGPAWRELRQYRTYLDGTTLTVTDEIVN